LRSSSFRCDPHLGAEWKDEEDADDAKQWEDDWDDEEVDDDFSKQLR